MTIRRYDGLRHIDEGHKTIIYDYSVKIIKNKILRTFFLNSIFASDHA